MSVNIYEYQFGIYVRASNEQKAWEQVRDISEALNKALDERNSGWYSATLGQLEITHRTPDPLASPFASPSTVAIIPPTITVRQAARVMQVEPSAIYKWIKVDFPHLRLGGTIKIPTTKLANLLGITPQEVIAGGLGVVKP